MTACSSCGRAAGVVVCETRAMSFPVCVACGCWRQDLDPPEAIEEESA